MDMRRSLRRAVDYEVQLGPGPKHLRVGGHGIILGLRARDLTGKGQPVHITMLNANAWANAMSIRPRQPPSMALPDAEIQASMPCTSLPLPARVGCSWVVFQTSGNLLRTVQRETSGRSPLRDSRGAAGNDQALNRDCGNPRGRTAALGRGAHQGGHRLCPGRRSVGGRVYADLPTPRRMR